MDRRTFLKGSLATGIALLGSGMFSRAMGAITPGPGPYGPLQLPDANGLRLPAGFTSRLLATTGEIVPGTDYVWHAHPDGGACFPRAGGGWIYTCNAEAPLPFGGAGSLFFDASGNVVGGTKILTGTNINCAGGPTPWHTWLSCEEYEAGLVWECDPTGVALPKPLPALGTFKHEAAAVDPVSGYVYLTEDESDGRFYRFRPAVSGDLTAGVLEVATVDSLLDEGPVLWTAVPNPNPVPVPGQATRHQVASSTRFRRGEGAWFDEGRRRVYFATTSDDRVWSYDVDGQTIEILYDGSAPGSPLRDPDNLTVAPSGDLYAAEDDDNLEIVVLTPDAGAAPFMRITNQSGTEVCGVAFNPAGTHMYFSSQRAIRTGFGKTYEITGPFRSAS